MSEQVAGFGRGRRLRIGASVALTVLVAIACWALANYVSTRPGLRRSIDLTRDLRFTFSPETEALVAKLREKEVTLEIRTFFQNPQVYAQANPVWARIVERVNGFTGLLLDRVRYFGGERVHIEHINVYKEIAKAREQKRVLGSVEEGTIVLSLSGAERTRRRKLSLVADMADIEAPPLEQNMPGRLQVPVLRAYNGEEAFASALAGLLQEEKLVACFALDGRAGQPTNVSALGYSGFARALVEDGFENRQLVLETSLAVPEDCSLLLLLQPELPIGAGEVAKIRSFLERGGSVLVTLGARAHDDFSGFLRGFGLSLGPGRLLNGIPDPTGSADVRYGDPQCAELLLLSGLNRRHEVTAGLARDRIPLRMRVARSLRIAQDEGLRITPLLSTNPFTWEGFPQGDGRLALRPVAESDLGVHHVGVVSEIAGEDDEGEAGQLVVLSGELFRNGGGLIERNVQLARGLANWLAREDRLVNVPSRSWRAHPIEASPQQVARVERVVLWFLPGVFLVLTFAVVWWRRRA